MENGPFIDGLPNLKMVMFYSYVKLPEGNVFILKAKVQRIVPPSFLPTLMHRKIDSLGLTAFFFHASIDVVV
jgi:hypothetical protein